MSCCMCVACVLHVCCMSCCMSCCMANVYLATATPTTTASSHGVQLQTRVCKVRNLQSAWADGWDFAVHARQCNCHKPFALLALWLPLPCLHFFHWCQVCNSLSHDVVRVLQKKQPPTHTRSYGAVRAPLPPIQCWAQRVYTTAFKKNNHFSNPGLSLELTSTLSWGCRGCCNSTS